MFSSSNLSSHPDTTVCISDKNKGMVQAKMEFGESLDTGSSEFVFTEIVKVVLRDFVPYINGLAKMTLGATVKSSTSNSNFHYTLGDAVWLTSLNGSEILPRSSLESLMHQVQNRLYNKSSSRGVLLG